MLVLLQRPVASLPRSPYHIVGERHRCTIQNTRRLNTRATKRRNLNVSSSVTSSVTGDLITAMRGVESYNGHPSNSRKLDGKVVGITKWCCSRHRPPSTTTTATVSSSEYHARSRAACILLWSYGTHYFFLRARRNRSSTSTTISTAASSSKSGCMPTSSKTMDCGIPGATCVGLLSSPS